MQLSNAISHPPDLAVPAIQRIPRVPEHDAIFPLALLYAIGVSPFIGGVRGWPCTLGWLIMPLLYLWKTGRPAEIGLRLPGPFRQSAAILTASVAIGVSTGFAFYFISGRFPLLSQFTLALPVLHKSFVGTNVRLFLILIPIGHFVHELFYRGYLQRRLASYLNSSFIPILLCALLYAWTHIFIYSSQEFQQAMTSITGDRLGGIHDVQRTLTLIVSFSFVESVLAGIAVKWTKSIFPAIAIRSSNLLTLCLLVYSRMGLLG
jgi:membrane protease YdiL (CAAX protease family)